MESSYKTTIAAAFSAAATTYDKAAFVEQVISSHLLERVQYFQIKPQRILDVGCGTGMLSTQLHNLFPASSIIGIDLALGMVNFASGLQKINGRNFLCADAEYLPFAKQSFDLVIANCSFMWIQNTNNLMQELARILTKDGLLIFSTFGPNTLSDLNLTNTWPDIIQIGNALTAANMRDPVIESEQLNCQYEQLRDLLQDLSEAGTCNVDLNQTLPAFAQSYAAIFEVIYGHAWGNTARQFKDKNGNVFVPIETLLAYPA